MLCECHGLPMWSNGPGRLVCQLKRAAQKRKAYIDPVIYAAQRDREDKQRARKALLDPHNRPKLKRMRVTAASRYDAVLEMNRAVRRIDTSIKPIDRGAGIPPLCACHHEPMRSNGDHAWRCGVERREYDRKTDRYDPVKSSKQSRRRRAAKRGVRSEPYTREEIYERDAGKCRYCDEQVSADWHVAHLLSLARGGEDTLDNVAVSCAACNIADGIGRLPVQLHLPRAA